MATLLERDTAMATLHALRVAAGMRKGCIALVTGEAGQGKTTLLRHFAADLPSGTLLLESGCDPLITPSPLAPLHEVAQRLGLSADDLANADRGALFASTLDALAAGGPCVWIIEDVHWADGATLDLIRFVGRRIDRTAALLVLSFRSDELGPDHPVRTVVGDVSRSAAVGRVELEPMSVDAVRVLCGNSDAEHIHAVTRGNAFFVTEIAAGTGGVLPASIRDAVAARVARLPDDVRKVIEAVAVAPRSMSYEQIGRMVAVDTTVIGRAATVGILVADADGLRFRHDLARQTVEQSIPVPARRLLHLGFLELLIEEGTDDRTRLAHHAIRSGDATRIVEHCPPAARDAAARLAYREASELMHAALRHQRSMTVHDLVDNIAVYVDSMSESNRAVDVADATNDLLAAAERSGDPALLTTALRAVGRQRYASGSPHEARTIGDRAIEAAARCDDPGHLADALVRRAQLSMLARRTAGAVDLVERALALLNEPDSAIEARALNCLGCVEIGMGGDVDRGMELLRRSLAIGEQVGDAGIVSAALVNLGSGAGEVRRYDEATTWLERAIEFSEARDADFTTLYVRAWLDRVRFERGEWDAIVDHVTPSRDDAQHTNATLTRDGTVGRLAVRRGESGATERLRDVLDRGDQGDLQHVWPPLCGLAEAHWLAGRPADGRQLLRQPYERAFTTDSPWAQAEIGWWLWRCGGEVRVDERDRTPFDQHVRGDWAGAADRWLAIGCAYEEALARADGPPGSKLHALEIFDRLGAVPAASWLRQRLREDGVASIPRGPRRSTLQNPAGLTRRQSEVLELAAEGLTNVEIADRLFVSPKTVEHHMSAVLSKLGVTNRRAAIRCAAGWFD